jgi:hypothetical protein
MTEKTLHIVLTTNITQRNVHSIEPLQRLEGPDTGLPRKGLFFTTAKILATDYPGQPVSASNK